MIGGAVEWPIKTQKTSKMERPPHNSGWIEVRALAKFAGEHLTEKDSAMRNLNVEELRKEYDKREPLLQRLAETLEKSIKNLLEADQIKAQYISYRVKTFKSFSEKIVRKGYEYPFKQTEDLCGLRIVAFFKSDLDKINSMIEQEFNVLDVQDKQDAVDADRFGYRSHQYIVSIKEEWLKAPEYRSLGGLKAELQVRSILMHAWAELSHKLAYKKKEDIPKEFFRQIYQLSAILENLDDQFDLLGDKKTNYQKKVQSEDSAELSQLPLNVDSLQAILDRYFPDRDRSEDHTASMLYEMIQARIAMKGLLQSLETTREALPKIEIEESELAGEIISWAQTGAARISLDITHPHWRVQDFPEYVRIPLEKWTNILQKKSGGISRIRKRVKPSHKKVNGS